MRTRTLLALLVSAAAATACTAILGDFDVGTGAGNGDGGSNEGGSGDGATGGDGAVPCTADQTACSGSCFDLKTSATNCGKCGKTCFGGTCSGSVCAPYVVAKSPTTGTVAKLATDGTRVVWADTGIVAVLQIGAGGGSAITLAPVSSTSGGVGQELALANGLVAFNYIGGSSPPAVGIAQVDVADSGIALIPGTLAVSAVSMNPNATHLFYANSHGTMSDLNDCTISPGDAGPCTGVGGGRFGNETAADSTYMFFDLTGADVFPAQSGLYLDTVGATIGADNPTIFTTAVAQSLAVDGTWAYWTESLDGGAPSVMHRTLESAPGTSLQTPVDVMAAPAFATDGANVYYWNGTNVVSRPTGGGPETVIAPAVAFTQIAVGGGLLVWTDGTRINGVVL